MREYWWEEQRISAALNGVPAYRPTEEERARVQDGFGKLLADLRPKREQQSKPLQPIGTSVSPALKQAIRERDELEQWLSGQSASTL
jgi:hypothetical protein